MGANCSYNCCAKDDINYIKKAQEVELDNVINRNHQNPTESNILPTQTNRMENIPEFKAQQNELNAMKDAYDTKKDYQPNQLESSKNNSGGKKLWLSKYT